MRLEIGGGPSPAHPEFVQYDAIDWQARTGCDYLIGDARNLPFASGSCGHVFASNLLEHFCADETTAVLTEWARVLRFGGQLELIVPDSMGVLSDFFNGVNNWTDCAERLRGSMDYPGNEHFQAFTISTFPAVIAQVATLHLFHCEPSHAGGGIHTASRRI
jgi:predicted SAM-dependent methyltransferase